MDADPIRVKASDVADAYCNEEEDKDDGIIKKTPLEVFNDF